MLGSITTQTLARMLGAELLGPGDIELSDLAGIEAAAPGCLTFIRSPEYARKWAASDASAAIVSRGIDVPGHEPASKALLLVDDADSSLVALLTELERMARPPAPAPGVHPTAVVDDAAEIDPGATVGPLCIIGAGAKVSAGAILLGRVTLGANAGVGERTLIHPGVVIGHACVIGAECLLHANVSIGADGFGFIPHPSGQGLVKVPHLSNVIIGDRVEIGACACIDRGKFSPTTIGNGTKIDNLVQIGHNVRVGQHAVLCGQTGLGGSSSVGDGAMLGGQVGVSDNLNIGPMARVGAQSGVMRHIEPGETVFGTPAKPSGEAFRFYRSADRLAKQIRTLRDRLDAIEARLAEDERA